MPNVKVINIEERYERIVSFLYPDYSIVDGLYQFNKFIIKKDVLSVAEKERLNYRYTDAIFISSRIYDELWNEDKIKEEVLNFAKAKFHSRKRTIKTLATEGDRFIDELILFMYTDFTLEDEESDIMELFSSYGSARFFDVFMQSCDRLSINQVCAALETFIQKVLMDTESTFYKRAKMRIEKSLRSNIRRAIEDSYIIDPVFKSNFKDLVKLRFYTMLLYTEYYNKV